MVHPFLALRICPDCGADPLDGKGLESNAKGKLYCSACGWQQVEAPQ